MSQQPYAYPPNMPPQKKSGWGIGLILLVVVLPALVAVIGILAVLAIYGTRKYIVNAKQVEAKNSLAMMAKDAESAYARDGKVCSSATLPVPVTVPSGAKYMSTSADWDVDKAASGGFSCLGFFMSSPQYYQYDYKATSTGFTATARGDLDGDGVVSEFQIEGKVTGGVLLVSPTIKETNAGE